MSEQSQEFKNGLTAGIVLAVAHMIRWGNEAFTRQIIEAAGIKPDEDLSFCSDFDLEALREVWPDFADVYGYDHEPDEVEELKIAIGPELKPYKKQKEWLTPELLHSAPSAKLVYVDDHVGAQLEHPSGGPLTWVRCPLPNVIGVVRVDNKWHWHIREDN
jgi:hypothetical protein